MPVYEYIHEDETQGKACAEGHIFEVRQVSRDWPLSQCPSCGRPVKRQLGNVTAVVKKSNAELRDAGFTKLVRVDDGIFENVTRRDDESKYVDRRKPETFPHLHKTIED